MQEFQTLLLAATPPPALPLSPAQPARLHPPDSTQLTLQMDRSSPLDVTIIDKDESSDQAYHVVDGFVIEDSKSPFPVSHMIVI